MDDNSRRRRQNEPPMHAASSQRYPVGNDPSGQRRSFAGGSAERYRPTPINTSNTPSRGGPGGAAGAGGMGGAASYSGYYQEPVAAFSTGMGQNTMQYQSEYGQDARQTQGFGAYNPGMMYNVPQAGTQNAVYDTSQQFQARQPAALQMIATEVPAPYFSGEATSAAAAAPGIPGQGSSSNTPAAVYQQGATGDRAALLQNYQQSSGMGPISGISQPGSADHVMDDQGQGQQQQGNLTINSVEEAYSEYQSELREVFQNIQSNSLANAGELLMRVSKWLLSKVVDLGLTLDNKDLHADRIRLWNDFNHAWLALFQKQKDMMLASPHQRPPGLISLDNLEKMGTELVQLCDGIERHGLVDYQYGVWEEEIMHVLTECADLYEGADDAASGANAASSSHRR
ncbi:hypothetical protein MKZ38_010714 [Zalerion maritima]|uniref:Uncharacterized protein n=1 Tax=Zalerion maritima TaxID=339359 RepID=A0AAD5RG17_9PEZI|nr:hypothetical protein MKZ38_010714 [Zalerion maritima]